MSRCFLQAYYGLGSSADAGGTAGTGHGSCPSTYIPVQMKKEKNDFYSLGNLGEMLSELGGAKTDSAHVARLSPLLWMDAILYVAQKFWKVNMRKGKGV